jgi:phospholipase C
MNTIFENVGRDDYSWSIHYMDWCEAMAVEPLASNVEKFVHDQDFDLFIEKI